MDGFDTNCIAMTRQKWHVPSYKLGFRKRPGRKDTELLDATATVVAGVKSTVVADTDRLSYCRRCGRQGRYRPRPA